MRKAALSIIGPVYAALSDHLLVEADSKNADDHILLHSGPAIVKLHSFRFAIAAFERS
jgi:hypothetical protein